MATKALSFAGRTATEPLITAPLLYLLTRGPPHLRERILAPFRNNILSHNGVAKIAALITALKVLTSLGVVQRINAALNALALNNWHLGRPGKEWKFGPGKEEIVVITGASSGFGKEMVKGFQKCARVVAIDIALFPDELAKLQDVTFYQCDISDSEAIQDTCRQIRTRHGDPTVLINNAGIAPQGRSVLESTNADTERLFQVNLISHFALIREFLPGMLQQRKGHIVTVASVASFAASPGLLDYSCSKVAALFLSEGIRAECLTRYPNGECISTTSVHPYWHATGILSEKTFDKLRQRGVRVDPASNVSDAVVKQVLSGKSGRLFVPEQYKWISGIRNLPVWFRDLASGAWKGQDSAGFQFGQQQGYETM